MLNTSKIDLKKVTIAAIILVVALPFLTFAGNNKKIFVDTDASGSQDGSASHPYKTITQALKKAKSDSKIFIASGTYKENLIVPDGIELDGKGMNKTILKADDHHDSVVVLQGDAKLYGMTIRNGRTGVKVADSGKVKIVECRIQRNDWDGVFINSGKVNDDNRVSITDSEIGDNGRTGLFAEKRKLILMDTKIYGNDSDGAFFASGTSAWIQDTRFNNNSGSGMKAELDNSQIFTKSNSFIVNRHEGIEVTSFGGNGRIDINKSRMENNGNYGIARVQRKAAAASVWNGLTVENPIFANIHKGEISGVFHIFN